MKQTRYNFTKTVSIQFENEDEARDILNSIGGLLDLAFTSQNDKEAKIRENLEAAAEICQHHGLGTRGLMILEEIYIKAQERMTHRRHFQEKPAISKVLYRTMRCKPDGEQVSLKELEKIAREEFIGVPLGEPTFKFPPTDPDKVRYVKRAAYKNPRSEGQRKGLGKTMGSNEGYDDEYY